MDTDVNVRLNTAGVRAELITLQQDMDKVLNKMEVRNFNRGKTAFQRSNNLALAKNRMATRNAQMREREMNENNRLLDVTHAKQMRNISTLRSVGIVATAVGVAMLALTTKTVAGFTEFEMAMRKATAVSNVSASQFTTMSDMAEDMSIKLNMSATDAASAFYYLGSAGLSVQEQMNTFAATVTLAKAATISAAQAAEIMVDTLRGFKINTSKAAEVTDILAHSVISSNMTFLQMGETLSLVSGVARTTNNSLAQTSVAIQLMANIGIKGTRAGTTMRRSLLNLAAPSSKIARLFRALGIEISGQSGKIKPYLTLVSELNHALRGASEEQQNLAFRTLFGARAIAGQLEIFQTSQEKIDRMVAATSYPGSTGTSKRIAEKQMSAFANRIGRLQQRVAKFGRTWGELVTPAIVMAADALGGVVDQMDKAVTAHSLVGGALATSISIWGSVASSIGVVSMAVSALGMIVITTTGTWMKLLAVVGMWGGVVAVAVAGIALLVTSLGNLKIAQERLKISIDETARSIKTQSNMLKDNEGLFSKVFSGDFIKSRIIANNQAKRQLQTWNQELLDIMALSQSKFIEKSKRFQILAQKAGSKSTMNRLKMAMPGPVATSALLAFKDELAAKSVLVEAETDRLATLMAELNVQVNKAAIPQRIIPPRILDRFNTDEVLRSISGYYGDLRNMGEEYNEIQLKLLKDRMEVERKFAKDNTIGWTTDAAVQKLFDDAQIAAMREQTKKIDLETVRRKGGTGGFREGVQIRSTQMKDEMLQAGAMGEAAANTFQTSFSNALYDIGMRTKSLKEIFNDFFKSLNEGFMKLATEDLSKKIMSGMSGMFGSPESSAGSAALIAETQKAALASQAEAVKAAADQANAATNQATAITNQTAVGTFASAVGMFAASVNQSMMGPPVGGDAAAGRGSLSGPLVQGAVSAWMSGGTGGTGGTGTVPAGTLSSPAVQNSASTWMSQYHTGGLVGFSKVPRLHGGLEADEFPAILQAGEKVIPKNRGNNSQGSGGKTVIKLNITAMDSQSVFQAIEPLKKELADMMSDASSLNHPIRRRG